MRCVRWILAILVPFSLVSSKLPVYMVPAFPPVALLSAWYVRLPDETMRWRLLTLWGHRIVLALFAIAPVAALAGVHPTKGDEAGLLAASGVRVALISMAVLGLAGVVLGWRSIRVSSLLLPFTLAVPAAIVLTAGAPAINEFASSRPLVEELARQVRPGDEIGMYYTPHLWSRSMPRELESARQSSLEELAVGSGPDLLVVRSDKIERLGDLAGAYQQVSSVRFMGKTFNVYRRR